jgi:Carboxypeptidase regulatory-like domain
MAAGRAGEELAGQVVDARGAPVPDALVSIVAGTVPMPEIALLVDAEGRFALRLPDGRFTLRAHAAAGTGDAEVERPRDRDVVIAVR